MPFTLCRWGVFLLANAVWKKYNCSLTENYVWINCSEIQSRNKYVYNYYSSFNIVSIIDDYLPAGSSEQNKMPPTVASTTINSETVILGGTYYSAYPIGYTADGYYRHNALCRLQIIKEISENTWQVNIFQRLVKQTPTYYKDTYIGEVTAPQGTYPANGRHSDGYWYVFDRLLSDVKVQVNGIWKDASEVYVNVNGIWKKSDTIKSNVNGIWK